MKIPAKQSSIMLEERHFQMCDVSRNVFKESIRECVLTKQGHQKGEDMQYRKRHSVKEGGEGSPGGAGVYSWVTAGYWAHRATRSAWRMAECSGRESP